LDKGIEMFESYRPFLILGLLLIALGLALVLSPFLLKFTPALERLEKLPKILIYVYRRDNFYFITSPILIIIGLAYFVYLLWRLLKP